MFKYRLEFSKTGETKFVSHLDLVRLFSRAFKRADLPLAYSEGFNPHPKMSIGIPLSVGVTSNCELLDVELYEETDAEEVKRRLNEKMPQGIAVCRAKALVGGEKKLSAVCRAEYCVTLFDAEITEEELKSFLARETVEIEKKTKRSLKMTDILPDIFAIDRRDAHTVHMELATGSNANLKPEVVLAAMALYIPNFCTEDFAIHRERMTDETGADLMERDCGEAII